MESGQLERWYFHLCESNGILVSAIKKKTKMHMTRACAPTQRCSIFLATEAIANLSRVLREHCAGCRLPLDLLTPTVLLAICQLTLFTKFRLNPY